MFANNEIGTVHPVREIGKIAKERGIVFHCDACQSTGKLAVDVDDMGIDLLSLSAHKFHGPKGIGALYIRGKSPRIQLQPTQFGAGQERGLRSGTLNVPGIVGLGVASELVVTEFDSEVAHSRKLVKLFYDRIVAGMDGVQLNGPPLSERLPNNLNLSFAGVNTEDLMEDLKDEVAFSTGSACKIVGGGASHVLKAVGLTDAQAQSSARFGFGRFNTEQESTQAADRILDAARKFQIRK